MFTDIVNRKNVGVGDRLGDGKEVESFGVIAQKKGAGAVVASLWPVMDESTQLFMREFYRLHGARPNTTKSDALREAQLGLIRGLIRGSASSGITGRDRGTEILSSQPRFETDPKAPFGHPSLALFFDVVGISDSTRRSFAQNTSESSFASYQGILRNVLTVKVEKVKAAVDDCAMMSAIHRALLLCKSR